VESVPFLSERAGYEAIRSSSIYGGATGRWSRIIGYRFGGRFATWDNYPMVVRPEVDFGILDDSGRVGMNYVKVTSLEPTGELTFQFKQVWDLRLHGVIRYAIQDSTGKPVYHLPKYELGAQARANFGEKIRLDGAVVLRGPRTTLSGMLQEYDLPAFMDVRLGAQYRYNSQLDAVIRIDNLLNQRAEWWMGYPVQGIRANLGLVYKF
jgi:outer membrane cobalamin receptor